MRTFGAMKHITYSDKSLLVGDIAADTLTEYGAVLARHSSADTVHLNVIALDGREVSATFVLGPGSTLMAESSTSGEAEPDNTRAEKYMRDRMADFDIIPRAFPIDAEAPSFIEELDL